MSWYFTLSSESPIEESHSFSSQFLALVIKDCLIQAHEMARSIEVAQRRVLWERVFVVSGQEDVYIISRR